MSRQTDFSNWWGGISAVEDLPGLRYFENLQMFECFRCGKWMYGRWKMGEPVPSDVLMHVEAHRHPPEKTEAPPLPLKVRELLAMIAEASHDATPVSVLRDGKMTTGVAMKFEHWRTIVDLAARIKNQ